MFDLILGESGNLGRALLRVNQAPLISVPSETSSTWQHDNSEQKIGRDLINYGPDVRNIVIAIGVTNANTSPELMRRINVDLPLRVAKIASELGITTITFGTVAEFFSGKPNLYVKSKMDLYSSLEESGLLAQSVKHIRLHTLYGGLPSRSHMFVGQVVEAIRSRSEFRMTSGKQLREYHHVMEDAKMISKYIVSNISNPIVISHGNPLQLADLASYLFRNFGSVKNLKIGALRSDESENYDHIFPPSEFLNSSFSRSSIEEVGKYVEKQLATEGNFFYE